MKAILKHFKIKFQLVNENIAIYKQHRDWYIEDVKADEIWCNTMTFLYKEGLEQISIKIIPHFINEISFSKNSVNHRR